MMMRLFMALLATISLLAAGLTYAQDELFDGVAPARTDSDADDPFEESDSATEPDPVDDSFESRPAELPIYYRSEVAPGSVATPRRARPRFDDDRNDRRVNDLANDLEPSRGGRSGLGRRGGIGGGMLRGAGGGRAGEVVRGFELGGFDPQSAAPGRNFAPQLEAAERSVSALTEKLKRGTADERQAVQNELEAALGNLFDIRTAMREEQIARLENRIQTLRNQMLERVEKKVEIVRLRLQTLVYEANGLAF
ncbi:MAG: hypothetical protein ABGZ35_25515 [Planctomycetaceae bacterium]|jgi:hypothetical protein